MAAANAAGITAALIIGCPQLLAVGPQRGLKVRQSWRVHRESNFVDKFDSATKRFLGRLRGLCSSHQNTTTASLPPVQRTVVFEVPSLKCEMAGSHRTSYFSPVTGESTTSKVRPPPSAKYYPRTLSANAHDVTEVATPELPEGHVSNDSSARAGPASPQAGAVVTAAATRAAVAMVFIEIPVVSGLLPEVPH